MLDPTYPGRRDNGWNLQTHGSGLVEQVLEYQFLAALTRELLRRGMRFEVLRGDTDLNGHDLVVEADGIMRHIQLKGMKAGGKSRRVPINTQLANKPAGCVVWMTYEPITLEIATLRWFGSEPGERLPCLGDRVTTHTRSNGAGPKSKRPAMRNVTAGKFTNVSIAELTDRLFGAPKATLPCPASAEGAN